MAATYLFSDDNGRIPDSTIQTIDGVPWVGLNCSLDILPGGAMSFINRFSYHTGTAALKDNGCYESMEYSLRPDWHQHDLDFRAWIPVKPSPSFDDPWFLQPDQEEFLSFNAHQVYVVKEQWRERMKKDLGEAAYAVQDILSRAPFTNRQPRPGGFHAERLHGSRSVKKDAMALVAGARRAMLDYLGFFNWRMAACYHWDRELKKDTIKLMNGYQLDRFKKRGVLVHLARDWKELNIPLLLTNDVPVLYPWTAKEETDLRFACLAPSILAAFRERRLTLGEAGAEHFPDDLLRDSDFTRIFQYSYFLEELNEPYAKPLGSKTVIPKDMPAFLKDFRSWTIRSVLTKKERTSCKKLFHYTITGGKVVFWRFRPITSSPEDRRRSRSVTIQEEEDFLSDDDDSEDEMDTLSQIREQFKGVCAPRPGEKFDLEDGRQTNKPYFGNECFERSNSRVPARGRPRGRSTSPRASSSRISNSGNDTRDPPGRVEVRARSPFSRLEVQIPLSREEAARIDRWADQSHALMEKINWVELSKEQQWRKGFLDHAYLLVESPNARVRLRLFACYNAAKTVAAILDFALIRCIPFRLAIPIASVPHFRESNLAPTERALAENYYQVGSGSLPLEYGRNGEGFAERYGIRFLDLLRRPHMRRIVSMGGTLAWLAWKSGGSLIQDFMNGPSIQVTQYGRGWSDGREENPLFVTSDELSPNDLDVLLGHVWDGTIERWVWPTEDLLREYCDFYQGEMTAELDRCLLYIFNEEVVKGKTQARTRGGWYQFFRRSNRMAARSSKSKESEDKKGGDGESRRERLRLLDAEFEEEEAKLKRIFEDDWARIRVRDIRLPGICR
ncbi:hypothetical protein R3P38DRAFT_2517889 [Favolaschia claudopus]|uniref:Uncharacterized protein n=1 Tax=Favolaschia claudopus TaxID=2862362 RepID=A0AAW0C8E1_9AGAR